MKTLPIYRVRQFLGAIIRDMLLDNEPVFINDEFRRSKEPVALLVPVDYIEKQIEDAVDIAITKERLEVEQRRLSIEQAKEELGLD